MNAVDMFGKEVNEGDRVAYATSRGLRVGPVVGIKYTNHGVPYRITIDLTEHENLKGYSRLYVKRKSYDWHEAFILKLS